MIESVKMAYESLYGTINRYSKYLVVAFVIVALSLTPVGLSSVESNKEIHSEDVESMISNVNSKDEKLFEYGDPPTNHRTPSQRERVERVLIRWDEDYEEYHTNIAVEISEEAVVEIMVRDYGEAEDVEGELEDEGANMNNVEFLVLDEHPEDHWIRDYGPIPMIDKDNGDVSFINMRHEGHEDHPNAEDFPKNYADEIGADYYDMEDDGDWFTLEGGHKFVEGSGIFYTTEYLYELNEHLGDEEVVEEWATEWFNLVENDEGFVNVSGRHGPHHLDTQINILDETTVLVSEIENPQTGDEEDIAEMLDEIAAFFENEVTTRSGEQFDVERLPMFVDDHPPPFPKKYCTYTNSLMVNDIVLVPTFDYDIDEEALNIYESALPNHEIIGICAEDLLEDTPGGTIRRTTRQIPEENAPPSIEITNVGAFANETLTIEAEIITDADMKIAHLYYNTTEMDRFEKVEMEHIEDNTFEADLGTYDEGTEFDYFLRVEDDYNAVSYEGDAWNPYPDVVEAIELESIEVTEQPKLEYYTGETLDLTGMEVTEYYTDNTTKIVNFDDPDWEENYSADPEDGTQLKGEHHGDTVTITHEQTFTADTDELTVNHELTINVEGEGSTDPEEGTHAYEHGAEVNVQAIEDVDGWQFVNWTGDVQEEEEDTITITIDQDKSITARFLKRGVFEIEIVDYDEEVSEGEEFTVNYTVTNTWGMTLAQNIEFTVYDDTINEVYSVSENVELGENEVHEDQFIWETGDVGDYSFEIASEDGDYSEGSLSVKEEPWTEELYSNEWWPHLLLSLAAFIIIIGGLLYKIHSAKKEPIIEDVFLISKNNSMLILHNTRRLKADRDSDILASMFDSVQNFIEDSFQETGDWKLNKMEFGDNKVVVERGEHVYMAVVYEGELSEKKIEEIRDIIERIEDEFGEQLKDWYGNSEDLEGIKDLTQDLFS